MTDKIKKIKRILLVLFGIGLTYTVAQTTPLSSATLPKIGDIVDSKIVVECKIEKRKCIENSDFQSIQYAYLGKQMDESLPAEIVQQAGNKGIIIDGEKIEERNKSMRVFTTNKKDTYVAKIISGSPQYYRDDFGKWWETDYATDTPEKFNIKPKVPVKITLLDYILPSSFAASPETYFTDSSAVDGFVQNSTNPQTWGNKRGGTGTFARSNVANDDCTRIDTSTTANQWANMAVCIITFDATGLPDDANITTASVWLNGAGVTQNLTGQSVALTNSSPNSATTLATGDYTDHLTDMTVQTSDTEYTLTQLATANTYYEWVLNAGGIAQIQKVSGNSNYGVRMLSEFDNTEPTYVSDKYAALYMNFSETTGTSQDPYIIITYTIGGGTAVGVNSVLIIND